MSYLQGANRMQTPRPGTRNTPYEKNHWPTRWRAASRGSFFKRTLSMKPNGPDARYLVVRPNCIVLFVLGLFSSPADHR